MSDADDNNSRSPPSSNVDRTVSPISPPDSNELNEERIQNAVGFLSHPKVKSSQESSKRAFLQQKGLTKAEIDEAFRRVPETPIQTTTTTVPATTELPPSTLPSTSRHLQPPPPLPHHHHPAPSQPYSPLQPYSPPQLQPQSWRWSQVALGAGFVAASAYAVKLLVWPYIYDKYNSLLRDNHTKKNDSPGDVTESNTAKNNTSVIADAIRAQTTELAASIQAMKDLVSSLEKDQQSRADVSMEDRIAINDVRKELQQFAETLHDIIPPSHQGIGPTSPGLQTDIAEIKALLAEYLKTPRSIDGGDHDTTPGSVYKSARDIYVRSNAQSPTQLPSLPSTASPASDGHQCHDVDANVKNADTTSTANVAATSLAPSDTANVATNVPSHPLSYAQVLEMLQRGETPPGIRTDINDLPPDPRQPLPPSKAMAKAKPWHVSGSLHEHPHEHDDTYDDTITYGDKNTIHTTNDGDVAPESVFASSPDAVDHIGTAASSMARYSDKNDSWYAKHRRSPMNIHEAATSPTQEHPSVIMKPGRWFQGESSGSGSGSGGKTPVVTSLFHDHADTVEDVKPLIPDGSGLGRPQSKGWKPPPLPSAMMPSSAIQGREEEVEGQ